MQLFRPILAGSVNHKGGIGGKQKGREDKTVAAAAVAETPAAEVDINTAVIADFNPVREFTVRVPKRGMIARHDLGNGQERSFIRR